MISFFIEHATAGLWSFIWHWGLGIGAIILLLAADIFSTSIPIIGPWLGKVREYLFIAACAIAFILAGEYIGARDAAHRCVAQTQVVNHFITRTVTRVIHDKRPVSSDTDPYDSPNN